MKKLLSASLLLLLPCLAAAQSDDPIFNEGDWSAYLGDKNLSLITADKDEASGLGMVCGIETEKCSWSVLGGPGLCRTGDRVPVLISGHGFGGISSEMTCSFSDSEGSGFELRDFDSISALVSASDSIQLATPTQDAGITMVEYPTKGYLRAAAKLQRAHPPKVK